MDVWDYHRSLVSQAWTDALTFMQWRNTPLPVFVFPIVIFGVSLLFFRFLTSRSEARSQLLWYVISGAMTLAAVCALFFVFLLRAPYRVARIAHDAAAAQLTSARSETEALRQRLDDRRRQQEKADEYAAWIDSGRDISVYWADAERRGDQQEILKQRDANRTWLGRLRPIIAADFGAQAAARLNLGRPDNVPIGFSEPREHEARVIELRRMTDEMRDGRLPLRVR